VRRSVSVEWYQHPFTTRRRLVHLKECPANQEHTVAFGVDDELVQSLRKLDCVRVRVHTEDPRAATLTVRYVRRITAVFAHLLSGQVGGTALHLATAASNQVITDLLISAGCQLNTRNLVAPGESGGLVRRGGE